MNNRIPGVIRLHFRDKFTWLYLPWIIALLNMAVNLLVSVFLTETMIYSGGIATIYVFLLVMGILSMNQPFALALGFGLRRTDYYWGTMATAVVMSVLYAVLTMAFGAVERWTNYWWERMRFFDVPYFNDGSLPEQFVVMLSFMLHFFLIGFVVSCTYRRFGRNGLFILFSALMLALMIAAYACMYYGWWDDIFGWLAGNTAFETSLWLFLPTAAYALIAYALMRRTTA